MKVIDTLLGELPSAINHVGFVTRDLERMTGRHQKLLGVRYADSWTTDPIPLKARDASHTVLHVRVAFAQLGPIRLEVIEPLPGPSVYEDHLKRFGEGVHHFGFDTNDVPAFLEAYRELGVEMLMYGQRAADAGIGFAYFDTLEQLGVLTEVVHKAGSRR
ncbi:MAG: VOC family protein [Dehalococcoidia bacterium]